MLKSGGYPSEFIVETWEYIGFHKGYKLKYILSGYPEVPILVVSLGCRSYPKGTIDCFTKCHVVTIGESLGIETKGHMGILRPQIKG